MGASSAFNANEIQLANIRDTLAQTNERNVLNQGRLQAIEQNQRAVNSDLLLQQALQGIAGRVGPPVSPAAPTEQSSAGPAQSTAIPTDDSPGGIVSRQLSAMNKQAQIYSELAMTPGILPAKSLEFFKAADDLKKNIARESLTLMDNRREQYKAIGGIAGSVVDPESLQTAWSQIRQVDPNILKTLKVDVGSDGSPLPTLRTFNAMNNLAVASTTQEQKWARQHAMALEKQAAQESIARDQRHDEDLAQRREARASIDANAAASRENAQAQRESSNAMRLEGHEQRGVSQAQTVYNEYKTDPQVREYADHKKALTYGLNYITNPDGSVKPAGVGSGYNSAGDFTLARQFVSVIHPNYKGAMNDVKALSSLSNVPEKLAKMIVSVSEGALLPQSDRVHMVEAMKAVVNAETPAQIEREDQALQRLGNLKLPTGTDPTSYITPYAIRPPKGSATKATAETAGAPSGDNAPEGATATNPKTQQKMIKRNGVWQPM